MEKKLKITLAIIITVLLAVIAFIGVYSKDAVVYKNNLPDYVLSSELQGKNIASFVVKEGTEEEKLNIENYEKAKKIIEGRLSSLGVSDSKVRLDKNTGKIAVELQDDTNTSRILQYISSKGDFAITDSQDGTLLIGRDNIKKASIVYGQDTENNKIIVYLNIEFDKEGAQKLLEISKEYAEGQEIEDKEENESTENTENTENTETNTVDQNVENVENANENTESTENTESAENTENTESTETEEDKQKKITLTIEGEDIFSTYFGQEMSGGNLPISLGSASDSSGLQTFLRQGSYYTMLLNNDEMPIDYEVKYTASTNGNLQDNWKYVFIATIAVTFVIIVVYMIVKFKEDGVYAAVSMVAMISLLSLILRYTASTISINTLPAVVLVMVLDAYIITKILAKINKDKTYEVAAKALTRTYLEEIGIILTAICISIVFTFMGQILVYSFGMALFYGIISIAIANLVIFRTMILGKYKEN